MNNPATTAAPDTLAALDAKEESLIDEVLRQTPYVTAPRFAMPGNWAEVEALAKRICDAGWCPKSHRDKQGKPNQASVELAILQGMEVGVAPVMAVQGIAIINGVPAIWGDLMLAVVTALGLLEFKDEFIEGKGDDMRAVCRVKRTTRPNTVRREFSVAMAKRAGLSSKQGPWQGYPSRMLAMRARSWALRDEFADVLRGMASMEELRDAGALDRAIAATEGQRGTAQDITAALKGAGAGVDLATGSDSTVRVTSEKTADGSTKVLAVDVLPDGSEIDPETGEILPAGTAGPSDQGAKINTPASTSKHDGKSPGGPTTSETTDSPPPHDPETGEIRDSAPAHDDAHKPADETGTGETANRTKPSYSSDPAPTADLLGPTEADWMDTAQAMIARINDADSPADLDVIIASGHVKPELARMAKAAPQQHKAVTGFIAEKRKELSA